MGMLAVGMPSWREGRGLAWGSSVLGLLRVCLLGRSLVRCFLSGSCVVVQAGMRARFGLVSARSFWRASKVQRPGR
jgi:hypothetical protein